MVLNYKVNYDKEKKEDEKPEDTRKKLMTRSDMQATVLQGLAQPVAGGQMQQPAQSNGWGQTQQ